MKFTLHDGIAEAHVDFNVTGPFADTWELVSLKVAEGYRKMGFGTELMELITRQADITSMRIHLTAVPLGGAISQEALLHFYEKFGFEVYPGMGRKAAYSMLRFPSKH